MIKMIAGVYGYREGGIITPKDKNSEPFSLEPEREAELVERGLAVYANLIIPEEEPEPAGQNGDDSQDDEDGQNGDDSQNDEDDQNDEGSQNGDDSQNDEDGQKQKPEYSEKMKLPELQALAASYGLDAQKMRAKAEVIKLLDDYFKDDNEQPPSFGAIDPVE
ncbi:MAG: hypothetical protein OSJ59_05035 [Lachnospiraceae bacterium]|nr:hypothetical protein [Lachnospiraceae bacterium]